MVIASPAQTVIDATGTVEKPRNITSGRVGSIGRKLPIKVTLEFPDTAAVDRDWLTVAFVITNAGQNDMLIPISLHEPHVEPRGKQLPYTVQHLHLLVTEQEGVLAGGADLFGSEAHPDTFLKLSPGKWLRVLARFRAPQESLKEHKGKSLIGHAVLNVETLETVNNETSMDSQEIGSAISPAYNWKR